LLRWRKGDSADSEFGYAVSVLPKVGVGKRADFVLRVLAEELQG